MRSILQKTGHANWFRPFRNAGVLALGRAGQAILALGYIGVATRALGLEHFGYLVFVHSLIQTAAYLISFHSWQAVLRYGAKALARDNPGQLKALFLFASRLEAIAAILGAALLIGVLDLLPDMAVLPLDLRASVQLYALCLPFMIISSPHMGVLRLYERYDLLSWQSLVMPLVRFIGGLAVWLAGHGLCAFMAVWFAGVVMGRVCTIVMAGLVMYRRGIVRVASAPFGWSGVAGMPKLWRFLLGTHTAQSLNINNIQLGTLLSGLALGPAGAGVFRFARQIGDIMIKPVNKLFIPAIAPDMAWLHVYAANKTRRHMVLRSMGVIGAASVVLLTVLAIFGHELIALVAGEDFRNAYPVMLILAAAGGISAFTAPLEPMLAGAGRIWVVVTGRCLALLAYGITFAVLAPALGVSGVALATVLYAVVSAVIMSFFSPKTLRRKKCKKI